MVRTSERTSGAECGTTDSGFGGSTRGFFVTGSDASPKASSASKSEPSSSPEE